MTSKKIDASRVLSELGFKVDKVLEDCDWNSYQDGIRAINISDDEFGCLCSNLESARTISENRYWNWYWEDFIHFNLIRYPKHQDTVLMNAPCSRLVNRLIANGGVSSLKQYNVLARSKSASVRIAAVPLCDFDTLETLAKDASKKVRKLALERLGPSDYLDQMLEDKSADIRYLGVTYAPFAYDKLDGMVSEISRKVFGVLVKKIRQESLPLLLANRNLKDKYTSQIFQARMESCLAKNNGDY